MPDYISPPTTLSPGSIIWGYLRDSGGDTQEQSVHQQKTELTGYCQRYGLVIAHIFADVAKSGGSVVGRDAFLDMVDMSADAERCPLVGRQRNWPRNRCGIGIIPCGAEIEAIIRR